MLNLDLRKNLKRKGAMFIEYAMVLAFVIVVGVFFISDGGIKNSIASIFDKTSDTLEVAVNGGEKIDPIKNAVLNRGYWSNDNSVAGFKEDKNSAEKDQNQMLGIEKPIEIDGNGTYTITLNLDGVTTDKYSSLDGLGFMVYTKDNNGDYKIISNGNTGVVSVNTLQNGYELNVSGTGDKYYMGINVENKGAWGKTENVITDTQAKNYQEIIRNGLTVNKK